MRRPIGGQDRLDCRPRTSHEIVTLPQSRRGRGSGADSTGNATFGFDLYGPVVGTAMRGRWEMTQQLVNVLVGLFTALIGYILGRFWNTLVVWWRYRNARRFWRPALRDERFQVVVSRFESAGFREPTKVVGGGDAIAHRLLVDIFHEIGFKRPEFVYVHEHELDLSRNLILLGGPTTNEITREAVKIIRPGLTVVDPGPGIAMEVHDSAAVAESDTNDATEEVQRVFVAEPSSERMTDYGVIIRARNPFNRSKALVVISGAYGYGSWAGVKLTQTDEFLRHCELLDAMQQAPTRMGRRPHGPWRSGRRAMFLPFPKRRWTELECLFKVEVFNDRPQTPQMLRFRALPGRRARERGSSALRNGTDHRSGAAAHEC
jgi:hypothetical protein